MEVLLIIIKHGVNDDCEKNLFLGDTSEALACACDVTLEELPKFSIAFPLLNESKEKLLSLGRRTIRSHMGQPALVTIRTALRLQERIDVPLDKGIGYVGDEFDEWMHKGYLE